MTYFGYYEFPARFYTKEMAEATKDHFNPNGNLTFEETKEKLFDFDNYPDDPFERKLARIEFENNGGVIQCIDVYLNANKIPYDRYCSSGDGNPADKVIYRPGMENPKTILHSEGGSPYIYEHYLTPLMNLPPEQVKAELEKVLYQRSTFGIKDIDEYRTETKLGKTFLL